MENIEELLGTEYRRLIESAQEGTCTSLIPTHPAPVNSLTETARRFCEVENIRVHWDSEYCTELGYYGAAWPDYRTIAISPVRPHYSPSDSMRCSKLVPVNELPRVLWHEISHIVHEHSLHRRQYENEIEAEVTSYLMCLVSGRSYFSSARSYITHQFKKSKNTIKLTRECEQRVVEAVIHMFTKSDSVMTLVPLKI